MRPHKRKMLTAFAVCILLCFANYAYGGELEEEANVKQESQEQGPEPIVLEEPVVPMEENTNNSKGERSVELMPKKRNFGLGWRDIAQQVERYFWVTR